MVIEITCMQHLQLQKHEDLAPQNLHLCIVPSYFDHKDEAVFEMDLLQSKYCQCKSDRISFFKVNPYEEV